MHTGTQNRDGDIANYLQVEGPAAVSSGRRISGLESGPEKFSMKYLCRRMIGSTGLFLGSESTEMNGFAVALNARGPGGYLGNELHALEPTGVIFEHPTVGAALSVRRASQISWRIVRSIAVNMIHDLRDLFQVNALANGENNSVKHEIFAAEMNNVAVFILLKRSRPRPG